MSAAMRHHDKERPRIYHSITTPWANTQGSHAREGDCPATSRAGILALVRAKTEAIKIEIEVVKYDLGRTQKNSNTRGDSAGMQCDSQAHAIQCIPIIRELSYRKEQPGV